MAFCAATGKTSDLTLGQIPVVRLGMENKSSQGGTHATQIDTGFPSVSAPGGPGPTTGSSGQTNVFRENPGGGYEGPGRGHKTMLNSDAQMPVNPS